MIYPNNVEHPQKISESQIMFTDYTTKEILAIDINDNSKTLKILRKENLEGSKFTKNYGVFKAKRIEKNLQFLYTEYV